MEEIGKWSRRLSKGKLMDRRKFKYELE